MDSKTKSEMFLDYIAETREQLDTAERLVLQMEHRLAQAIQMDTELLNGVFRCFHTIKGSSGFFELRNIIRVAHEAEAVLEELRSGKITFATRTADLLISACDTLRALLAQVEAHGVDTGFETAVEEIVNSLRPLHTKAEAKEKGKWGLFESRPLKQKNTANSAMYGHFVNSTRAQIAPILAELRIAQSGWSLSERLSQTLDDLAESAALLELSILQKFFNSFLEVLFISENNPDLAIVHTLCGILEAVNQALEKLPEQTAVQTAIDQLNGIGSFATKSTSVDSNPVPVTPTKLQIQASPAPPRDRDDEDRASKSSQQDIRIATSKLDAMMNLVGELVVAEALVTQHREVKSLLNSDLFSATRQLGKIVRNIQEVALSMRMVPLTGVFQRMTRIVRDLTVKSGKKATLMIEGDETEVDKTVAELLVDPLVHIMRNAVDHGMESPGARIAAGKPATGTIRLTARHSGSEVHIIIEDTGSGLNREKILKRARAQGLIQGSGEEMADEAVWDLIFQPGFSTAETVTDISGRGVGMDIVRRNILEMNGRIEVRSSAGAGTRFLLRIPLTLAIIEGLVARIGKIQFVIPMMDSTQSLRYSAVIITSIDGGGKLAEYRGRFFPVLSLSHVLKIPGAQETISEKSLIVQVDHGGKIMGIIVDELLGNQHIVVKPMGGLVAESPGISGCTILGDGNVALIVDVSHLSQMVTYDAEKSQMQVA
ncbi:MAG: chemotaxis protein CheA [Spirochaetia bacterium]|nr:chemotaxis protein CheA [Spirochaetia bacterium]